MRVCTGYLQNECKSCWNKRCRVKQCVRIVQWLKSLAVPIQVKSAGCCSRCGARTQRTLMSACVCARACGSVCEQRIAALGMAGGELTEH